MYIKTIDIRNVGPIKKCTIHPRFDENGNPIPLIVIGSNGSGKTVLSSYICDSFIEFGKQFYTNIVMKDGSYYKGISPDNRKFNETYGAAIIKCEDKNKEFYYVEKTGQVKMDDFNGDDYQEGSNNIAALKKYLNSEDPNYKDVIVPKKEKTIIDQANHVAPKHPIESVFESNVICYFPSDRMETPRWLNEASIKSENEIKERTYIRREQKIYRILNNPIIIESSQDENSDWIADIMYNSSAIFETHDGKTMINSGELNAAANYVNIKNMIEEILCLIFGCQRVELSKNIGSNFNKFDILCYDENGNVKNHLINISQLSLGQATLFNIFMTIMRYAYQNNCLVGANFADIMGVVAIDEIDAHLDTDLQYNVLPKLIALFPKVQFIITTHSPLFLLGLENNKKNGGLDYDLIEMPNGLSTSVEKFSEFEKAFNALTNTNKEEEKISKLLYETINGSTNAPNKSILLVTEGKTDVKHIRWALEKFKAEGKYNDLNINFLDYKDNDTLGNGQMSKYEAILSLLPKFDNGLKVVFLYDIDKGKYSEDFSYKKHGPSAYSFQLPLPDTRKENKTPEELKKLSFSIEHLFKDEEIKKEYVGEDNISRRLFMGNEFDSCGNSKNSLTASLRNKCGDGKLDIIDASNGGVKKTGEADKPEAINYALSKDDFYNHIVADENQHVGHDGFAGLFDKLLEIANDN